MDVLVWRFLPCFVVVFTTARAGFEMLDGGCLAMLFAYHEEVQLYAGVEQEVVPQQARGTDYKVAVVVGTAQKLVHVASVAVHLLGEPRYAAVLVPQLFFYHLSEMYVWHGLTVLIAVRGIAYAGVRMYAMQTQRKHRTRVVSPMKLRHRQTPYRNRNC